jgi:3-hydroxymyristoyl/3-hydroxydecanoyl-(acyl carrier protein) dehydratase
MNFDVDRQLEKQGQKQRLFEPITSSTLLNKTAIEAILPHRSPMLLLDTITAIDLAARHIEAQRYLKPDDPGFAGHFPTHAVYPGVLQIEMAGQLGLCLGMLLNNETQVSIRLWKVHKAVFISELNPGDEVVVLAKVIEDNGATFCCAGQCLKAGKVASFSIIEAVYL